MAFFVSFKEDASFPICVPVYGVQKKGRRPCGVCGRRYPSYHYTSCAIGLTIFSSVQ